MNAFSKLGRSTLNLTLFNCLPAEEVTNRDNLYRTMMAPYKFYLSFEQASCTDYITEKLFNVLRAQNAIPVALGGMDLADYQRAAPPHSYVHVDEFANVRQLADRLEYLASNDTAYNEYFWWIRHYRVPSTWHHYLDAQCQLCQRLNEIKAAGSSLVTSRDLRSLHSSSLNCRNDHQGP